MDPAFWKTIADNDYAIPEGHALDDLTAELLGYLGSTDSVLRDDIGYVVLAYWFKHDVYQPDALRDIVTELRGNLKKGLGDTDNDSVLLRSFSALVLSELLYQYHERPYPDAETMQEILSDALAYLSAEKDVRGYLPDKGWAHSCAHTADLLWGLARSPHLVAADLERILDGIAGKIMAQVDYLYRHGEDDRLARAVVEVIERDLVSQAALTGWVDKLAGASELLKSAPEFSTALYSAKTNTKNLLRSLYFKLKLADEPLPQADDLCDMLEKALKKFGY